MSFCIPHLFDVPGMQAPPKWWDDAPGLRYNGRPKRTEIGDPRWRGAANRGFGLGTKEEITVRMGYHAVGSEQSLFISWHVKYDGQAFDPSGIPDRLWVAFQPSIGGGTSPLVLRIDLPHDGADKTADITTFIQRRPMTFKDSDPPLSNLPDWVNQYTRVWRKVVTSAPVKQEWAINMLVPIKATATSETDNGGLRLVPPFKMWYAVDIDTPTRVDSSTTGITGGILRVLWPTTPPITYSSTTGFTIPDPTNWEDYTLGIISDPISGTPSCPTSNGLSISYGNVGVQIPAGTGLTNIIKFSPSGPAGPANTMVARPTNNGTSASDDVAAHQVNATFKIAAWGSNSFQDLWTPIPGPASIDNKAAIPHASTADATNQIEFPWTVGEPFLSMLRNATLNTTTWQWEAIDSTKPFMAHHSCMFVQLSGAGLVFTVDSVFGNMDFSSASLVERGAKLVVSRPEGAPPQRDVYLMLEKLNMPTNTPASYNEGKFLETTIDRLIQEGQGESDLAVKLRNVQEELKNPGPSTGIHSITAILEDYLASLEYTDRERGIQYLQAFITALDDWLTAVKPDEAAAKKLAGVAQALADWLDSKNLIESSQRLIHLVDVLNRWLSGLQDDPATLEHGPIVVEAMRNWIQTLEDKNGIFTRLGKVLDTLEAWLKSGRSPGQLLELLNALRKLLSSLGTGDKSVRSVLIWFLNEVRHWLVGAAERMGQLIGAIASAALTDEEMDQVFPAFRVHVYYDTGQRWEENGKRYAILGLQPSFGHYLYHEDSLEGWQTSIKGAARVADNLYVVSATNGVAHIGTQIQAVEPGDERLKEDPIVVGGTSCLAALKKALGPLGFLVDILAKLLGQKV